MIKVGDLVALKRQFVQMHVPSNANPGFKKALKKGMAKVTKVLAETKEFRKGRVEYNRVVQLDIPSFHRKIAQGLVISTGWLKFVSRPKGKGHPEPKQGANP